VSDDELEVTMTGVEVVSSRPDEGADVGVDEGVDKDIDEDADISVDDGVDVGEVDTDELGLKMLSGVETEADGEVSRLSVELCV
jgi:hypothetical protein